MRTEEEVIDWILGKYNSYLLITKNKKTKDIKLIMGCVSIIRVMKERPEIMANVLILILSLFFTPPRETGAPINEVSGSARENIFQSLRAEMFG